MTALYPPAQHERSRFDPVGSVAPAPGASRAQRWAAHGAHSTERLGRGTRLNSLVVQAANLLYEKADRIGVPVYNAKEEAR